MEQTTNIGRVKSKLYTYILTAFLIYHLLKKHHDTAFFTIVYNLYQIVNISSLHFFSKGWILQIAKPKSNFSNNIIYKKQVSLQVKCVQFNKNNTYFFRGQYQDLWTALGLGYGLDFWYRSCQPQPFPSICSY